MFGVAGSEPGFFTLSGELDMAVEDQLRTALSGAGDHDARGIILDVSDLTFMDSRGLSVILETAAALQAPAQLVLRNPRESVRRLFEICLPTGHPRLRIEPAETAVPAQAEA
ncbi:MAG TPA: STAS domain-containing protein [Actinomycetota bacterium]|nr:STAS domain-containing protein [Actinomycetota bacterium]